MSKRKEEFNARGEALEKKALNRKIIYYLSAAAAAVLLLISFPFLKNILSPSEPLISPVVFNQEFQLVDLSASEYLSDSEVAWEELVASYKTEDCTKVISAADDALKNKSLTDMENQVKLLLGSCQIKSGDYAGARHNLSEISEFATTPFQQSEWYLVLLNLKEGKKEGLVKLEKIAQNERHNFQKQAENLLNNLNVK